MRRSPLRIAGISNIPDDISGIDNIPRPKATEPVEMRVVVALPPRPKHVDDSPSELIGSNAGDNAFRGAQHRRAVWRKDVDALV